MRGGTIPISTFCDISNVLNSIQSMNGSKKIFLSEEIKDEEGAACGLLISATFPNSSSDCRNRNTPSFVLIGL